jgi:hypothetical protein
MPTAALQLFTCDWHDSDKASSHEIFYPLNQGDAAVVVVHINSPNPCRAQTQRHGYGLCTWHKQGSFSQGNVSEPQLGRGMCSRCAVAAMIDSPRHRWYSSHSRRYLFSFLATTHKAEYCGSLSMGAPSVPASSLSSKAATTQRPSRANARLYGSKS